MNTYGACDLNLIVALFTPAYRSRCLTFFTVWLAIFHVKRAATNWLAAMTTQETMWMVVLHQCTHYVLQNSSSMHCTTCRNVTPSLMKCQCAVMLGKYKT